MDEILRKLVAFHTVDGDKPAHGSRPWLGDNAILPLIKILQDIQALFPNPGNHTNTCKIGMITGGEASNQVAARATAKLDIRVISNTEKAPILYSIEQICAEHNAS